ncbi:hypothetical protein T484DRAFT_1965854 [Baffinella frigidus]|nr:hypothetical protein T484DRAFT_1965854 [Cryptophyta sp. CCMP2293]
MSQRPRRRSVSPPRKMAPRASLGTEKTNAAHSCPPLPKLFQPVPTCSNLVQPCPCPAVSIASPILPCP